MDTQPFNLIFLSASSQDNHYQQRSYLKVFEHLPLSRLLQQSVDNRTWWMDIQRQKRIDLFVCDLERIAETAPNRLSAALGVLSQIQSTYPQQQKILLVGDELARRIGTLESVTPLILLRRPFEANSLYQAILSAYEQQLITFKGIVESQHREIISTMAVILKAIEDERAVIKKSQLLEMQSIFNRHCKYEEKFMEEHGYPDPHLTEHKKAHAIMNHYLLVQLKHREEVVSKEERKEYHLSLLSLLNDVGHDAHFFSYMERLLSEIRQAFNQIPAEILDHAA